jgi:hypothetical protein
MPPIAKTRFSAAPSDLSVRLLSATNPADGVLVARFNTPMRANVSLLSLQSWACVAASSLALPIALTEVVAGGATYPETVLLRYTGGGFDCIVSVVGVTSAGGAPLDPAYSSVPLSIVRPGDIDPTIRLFDTIWGPMGVSQRASQRRTVDQLVANRALATAVNQQLQQRLSTGDGTAGRDGRPGLART